MLQADSEDSIDIMSEKIAFELLSVIFARHSEHFYARQHV